MWIQEIVQEEVPLVLEQDTWIDLAKYIYVTRQNYIQVKISQPRLILNFLCLIALLIMN